MQTAPEQTPTPPRGTLRRIGWLLAAVLALYLSTLAVVVIFQRSFIYHPSTVSVAAAGSAARAAGFEEWHTAAGRAVGWNRRSRHPQVWAQVLVLHGNAGWAMDRAGYANVLQSIGAFDIYLLEYPGYGPRPGSPGQDAFYRAAAEAVQALPTNLLTYVIGESLGTAPACYVAGTQPGKIAGVLLVAPFANLGDVAQNHLPLLPARGLLRDPFPSAAYLRGYRGPVFVWLAGHDQVIPKRFGMDLFRGYAGPKQLAEFPQAGHDDLPLRPRDDWEQVIDFWLRHRPAPPRRSL